MSLPPIRKIQPQQWAILREIRIRALTDTPDAFGSTLERETVFTANDWISRLEREDCVTFIAFLDVDSPIGLVTCAPYGTHAGLYSMWVDPQQRGRGIGGMLVDAVIDWAKERGYQKILLDVGDYNAPAIALYKSKGFLETGIKGTLPHPREHIAEHQRELVLE